MYGPTAAALGPALMQLDQGDSVVRWLLAGDVAIQYQVWRDLLGEDRRDIQSRIDKEGWGAALLARRHSDGTWGSGFYQPKWTSSHYTLLDLKNLGIDPHHALLNESVHLISQTEKREDGGIGPGKSIRVSDVCVNAMFLNYASYFGETESELRSIVDFLVGQQMADAGFNCFSNRRGAKHSSLHSTISVLEGFCQYMKNGYGYRVAELDRIAEDCLRFILLHKLFRSDRTGEIINPDLLKLPHPWRWKYNILRALDGFRSCAVPWDDRMQDAVDELARRRGKDGRWRAMAAHPGAVHVTMEKAGQPGRWNTLIALRVLFHYGRLPPTP